MFENARRGRQARNFSTNVPKITMYITRRCGSVYLGVVVLRVCEVCYVYESYVGIAVVLYI